MLSGLILVSVFLTVVLAIWGVYALLVQAPLREQRKLVAYRLDSLNRAQERGVKDRSVELFKQEILSSMPVIQQLLLKLPKARFVQRALRQADWEISITKFLSMCIASGVVALLVATFLWKTPVLSLMLAVGAACLPYVVLMYRRRKRLDKFLDQFPEGIDLMARAVRAGHAITTGFDMVADEMEDPIAKELRQTHDEQKFGLPIQQALLNLQERVPLMDVRMLATAIAIQREVGGNLAEVLDKIAHTIRERQKIRRQIRVYTAQGRLTGYILAALPILVGLLLSAISPGYFGILLHHEYGLFMIAVAALLQVMGFFWIRKIINIKI